MTPTVFEATRRLRGIADGPGGRVAVVSTRGEPVYAGLHRAPARTLLEAVCTFVAGHEKYAEVLVATGRGPHLPRLHAPDVAIGVSPSLWWLRRPPNDVRGSGTEPTRAPVDQRPYLDTSALARSASPGAGPARLVRDVRHMAWLERLGLLLQEIEKRAGREWRHDRHASRPGGADSSHDRRLVVVDTSFLSPGDTMPPAEPHLRAAMEERFAELPAICEGSGLDVVFVAESPDAALALSAGKFPLVETRRRGETGESEFVWPVGVPKCGLASTRVSYIEIPQLAAPEEYGPYLRRSGNVDRALSQVLRTDCPVLPADPLDEIRMRIEGQQAVKDKLTTLAIAAREYQSLVSQGRTPEEPFRLNARLIGPPGSGKTTVARLIGQIYAKFGVLPSGGFREIGGDALIAEFVGQSEGRTRAVFEGARGGVLFIDEAYHLAQEGEHGFGRNVASVMLKYLEDFPRELAILVAGYSHEIDQFLALNPGLPSRFEHCFEFVDYSDEELVRIAKSMVARRNATVHPDADEMIRLRIRQLREACANIGRPFANARVARSLVGAAWNASAVRRSRQDTDSYEQVLLAEDFVNADVAV